MNAERLNLAIKYRNLTIDNIIQLLQDDRSTWLCKAIDNRDTISHYKGSFNLSEYTIEKIGDEINVALPKILNVHPGDFLENTYKNCIEFIQDFMCLFIELWLPPLFCITQASDSNPTLKLWRESNMAASKYIKFTLGSREWVWYGCKSQISFADNSFNPSYLNFQQAGRERRAKTRAPHPRVKLEKRIKCSMTRRLWSRI